MTTGDAVTSDGRPELIPGTDAWREARRTTLFEETFAEILQKGERRDGLRATDSLRAWEITTRERGGIVYVENPDPENTVTGSVIPYLPEITLGPKATFAWVHDTPIGASSKYLAAYAGLVKSDASILTMGLRPDPFEGARVYVYGTPGETREVVLFNAAGGETVAVIFADAPQIYPVGPSQVVALSTDLAGRTFFCKDDDNAPVVIGPDDVTEHDTLGATVAVKPEASHCVWTLAPDGNLTETWVESPSLPNPPSLSAWLSQAEPDYTTPGYDDSAWQEMEYPTDMGTLGNEDNIYGWYRAKVYVDEAADVTLHFSDWSDRLVLWVNGARIGAFPTVPGKDPASSEATFSLRLQTGENTLCVLAEATDRKARGAKKGIYGPVTLIPSGGCYLLDISRWRFHPGLHGETAGWFQDTFPIGDTPVQGDILWYQASFSLPASPGATSPLQVRLNEMGKGQVYLNGHRLGVYSPAQVAFSLPESKLKEGENVLTLVETEGAGFTPQAVALVWGTNATVAVHVAF